MRFGVLDWLFGVACCLASGGFLFVIGWLLLRVWVVVIAVSCCWSCLRILFGCCDFMAGYLLLLDC